MSLIGMTLEILGAVRIATRVSRHRSLFKIVVCAYEIVHLESFGAQTLHDTLPDKDTDTDTDTDTKEEPSEFMPKPRSAWPPACMPTCASVKKCPRGRLVAY